MKTWLKEQPWMSKGFYTSELHLSFTPELLQSQGWGKCGFPREKVAAGWLGVIPQQQSHLSWYWVSWGAPLPPVAPQGEQRGWEVPFSEAEIPDILQLILGTKGQRRKAYPREDRNRAVFFMFLLLQDYLVKNTGPHETLNFSVTITMEKANSCEVSSFTVHLFVTSGKCSFYLMNTVCPPHPMHHPYLLNPRQLTDISTKMKVKQSLLAWLGGIWCKVHSLGFGLWFVKKCRTLSSLLSAHLWLQLTGQNVAQQSQTINYCTVEQETTGSV